MDVIEIRPEKAEKAERYISRGTTILAAVLIIVSFYHYINDLDVQYHVVILALIALVLKFSDFRNPKQTFGFILVDDKGLKWRGRLDTVELEWNKVESLTYYKSKIAYKFRNGMKGSLLIPWLIRRRKDEIQNALKTYCTKKDVEFINKYQSKE